MLDTKKCSDLKKIIIHPTHRKFIKILRECAETGKPIALIDEDVEDFKNLIHRTKKRGERHRGIYLIALRAMRRQPTELQDNNSIYYINREAVDFIEKQFARVERKRLCATLQGAYLLPIMRSIIKRIDKN